MRIKLMLILLVFGQNIFANCTPTSIIPFIGSESKIKSNFYKDKIRNNSIEICQYEVKSPRKGANYYLYVMLKNNSEINSFGIADMKKTPHPREKAMEYSRNGSKLFDKLIAIGPFTAEHIERAKVTGTINMYSPNLKGKRKAEPMKSKRKAEPMKSKRKATPIKGKRKATSIKGKRKSAPKKSVSSNTYTIFNYYG